MEEKSRIVNRLKIVPSDGTNVNCELSSVRSNMVRKPTYAEIVGKAKRTDRRVTIKTNR